jgi:histidinol phosphatase-like PHP family hydrolase|tara:strand:+ start:353 stop:616 length:264 start_codon:yes stop_codon:yes gene_type:complete
MKIGLLAVLATLIGGVSYSVASTNNKEAEDIETTVDVVTPHSVRVVYLPGNLCQVETDSEPNSEDLQDYVRACIENRQLRLKLNESL